MKSAAFAQAPEVFEAVKRAAQRLGAPTFVVGGFVRDFLLGRTCKDLDFVCVGDGIALANEVAVQLNSNAEITIFKTYGTAMLRHGDFELEFVGARKESYSRDSRKPLVAPGTLEDDQCRRDFTINALAISLNQEDEGALLDSFNGQEDLKKKIIRTPMDPDVTFSDDPLRMMRALRFAAQLNFDIHPDTFESIQRNKERLEIISMERIHTELNKIIMTDKPSYGFKLLFHSGLLKVFFPELVALQGVEAIDNQSHKDNFYHTLQVLDNVSQHSQDLWLRWAAILHDIGKPATKRFEKGHGWTFHGHEEKGARMVAGIFRRLKMPLAESMQTVQKLVRMHHRPIAMEKEHVTDSAVRRMLFDAGDDFEKLMMLCRADVTSKNNVKVKRYLENFDRVEERAKAVEEHDNIRSFQPVFTGTMIMDLFALPPSKEVGELKTALREAILDGIVPNKYEESKAFVEALWRQKLENRD